MKILSDTLFVIFVSLGARVLCAGQMTGSQGLTTAGSGKTELTPLSTSIQKMRVTDDPLGIIFDGENIWVANNGADTLSKIRPSDGKTLATVDTGVSPSRLAFDGANVWVGCFADNTVQKFRASDGLLLGTFDAGPGPSAILYDGTNIWVANFPIIL